MTAAQPPSKAILREVYRLVKGGWTQHCFAKDADGYVIAGLKAEHQPEAVCFCLSGALGRALGGCEQTTAPEYAACQRAIARSGSDLRIPAWNDRKGRTQAEVLAIIVEAAKEAV